MKIAVIAHDGKKADMVAFVMKRLEFFRQVEVIATGTTGKHIEHAGLKVKCLKSGPLGGDAQIASMIADGEISGVVFFIDPLEVHPHQVDVNMLLRICNVYNTPLATNYMTASYIISGLEKKFKENLNMYDISESNSNKIRLENLDVMGNVVETIELEGRWKITTGEKSYFMTNRYVNEMKVDLEKIQKNFIDNL